jgi:hypothetical protein
VPIPQPRLLRGRLFFPDDRLAEPDGEAPSELERKEERMSCPIGDGELDRDEFGQVCAACGRCRTIATQVWPTDGGV